MELHIHKEEVRKKGLLRSEPGSIKEFVLQAKLILTDEEKRLIEIYGSCLPALHWVEGSQTTRYYTIFDFIKGVEFRENYIVPIIELEEKFREIPKKITLHLNLANNFKGDEIITAESTRDALT